MCYVGPGKVHLLSSRQPLPSNFPRLVALFDQTTFRIVEDYDWFETKQPPAIAGS